ncbi:ECF transporter S component [Phytoactinopolyspora alkaliphila]|uniref:ECF transporter S component n=1 Tax=Phytoactinopolyspora alkaliphila TaxID=1783498 RepID=A0A6N9YKK2_9ACTN|nr:ECF transporter S component [Phytoactinopolyspora alkaliphila]NED95566.1 ECF transporter S component [Phytoactinopolyspora alkaliphila]
MSVGDSAAPGSSASGCAGPASSASGSTATMGVRGGGLSWLVVGAASVTGLLAFTWMFFAGPGSFLAAAGTDGTWLFSVLLALLAAAVGAQLASGAFDAKTVALIGVLSAAGGALRVLGAGTAGLDPMFLVLVVAGRALGPLTGFVTGGLTMLAGGVLTGRVGPWTPFQMLACAWVAMGAGLLPGGRRLRDDDAARPPRSERWLLAAYGLVAGVAYGFLTSMWFWPVMAGSAGGLGYDATAGTVANLTNYLSFWLLTAMGWDLPRGILTALLCLAAGPAILAMIRRAITRAGFAAPVRFHPEERL